MKSLFAIAILCAPIQAQPLDGVWRSQGYGYVYDIHGPALKSFEVTTATCVPGFTATRETSLISHGPMIARRGVLGLF